MDGGSTTLFYWWVLVSYYVVYLNLPTVCCKPFHVLPICNCCNMHIIAILLGWSEDVGPLVLGWMSLVHTFILHPVVRTMDLVLIYAWKKNGNVEYKALRSLLFWDPSLLMIIGVRKHWMEGHRALNHIARRKRKGSLRKKRGEIKRRKRTRRNPSIIITTITKAEEESEWVMLPVSGTEKCTQRFYPESGS